MVCVCVGGREEGGLCVCEGDVWCMCAREVCGVCACGREEGGCVCV